MSSAQHSSSPSTQHAARSTQHSSSSTTQHFQIHPSRILIRATNWIGDAVMTEPAISAVRATYPTADISLLARPAVAELFEAHPAINRLLVYDDRGRHRGWGGKWTLAADLRRHRFDLAVLLQNAFEAALLALLAGIPRRYGYATDGRTWLLTDPVRVPHGVLRVHQTQYYLDLLKPLGIEGHQRSPQLFVTPEEEDRAIRQLRHAGVRDGDLLIGLNPGSVYGGAKRWLPDRFAATADRLAQTFSARVVIVGARGEESLGEAIGSLMTSPPIVLSGRTSIRDLMAVIKRCRLFLTNDTGPMHMAAAFGVPVVAVFGPTDVRTTAPFGDAHTIVRHPVDCSPCLLRECPIDHRCMTRVTVDMVYEAAVTKLTGSSGLSESSGLFGAEHEQQTNQTYEANPTNQINQKNETPLHGVTVFLDRDGTINEDSGYVTSPGALRLLPGSGEAIARLNRAGARVVVISNQSAVARGMMAVDTLAIIHGQLRTMLQAHGAWLDGIFCCPHHPDDGCGCRKPEPGLIHQAAGAMAIDLARAYMVGDQSRDIELARRLGLRSVLVTTGKTTIDEAAVLVAEAQPDHIATGLGEAVDWIMQDARQLTALTKAPYE